MRDVGSVVRWGIFKKTTAYIAESDESDALTLSLAESNESSVIDFDATFRQDIFENYVKGGLGKVDLGEEPYDVVGNSDVVVSFFNGPTLKLRNVKHVPKLKRNLISVGQLVYKEMKTTFDGDVCKMTKGVMVMAHGKKVFST